MCEHGFRKLLKLCLHHPLPVSDIGYLETPAINYVGEISTPKLRGILTSYSAPIIYMGIIFEFILGKLFDWRTVALINSTIPILTIAAMIQVSYVLFQHPFQFSTYS